jgi:hypothetical protein
VPATVLMSRQPTDNLAAIVDTFDPQPPFDHQPVVPGAPLNGPMTSSVIQPP